jgi:hypothetical protein
MHKFFILYWLFHHNTTFFFPRECVIIFTSASEIGIICMQGKYPGNESFRNYIASPFPIC